MPTPTRTIARLLTGLAALLLAQAAQAGHADAGQAALMDARGNLVAMIHATDKAAREDYYGKVTRASKAVDDPLSAALGDAATTPDQAAKHNELKTTWEALKQTREGEIVPAVRAGKTADAKAVATGIQAERMKKMKKMKGRLGELGAK
jgi:hypothetical protein